MPLPSLRILVLPRQALRTQPQESSVVWVIWAPAMPPRGPPRRPPAAFRNGMLECSCFIRRMGHNSAANGFSAWGSCPAGAFLAMRLSRPPPTIRTYRCAAHVQSRRTQGGQGEDLEERGSISSLAASFGPKLRLYLQPVRLSRARAAVSPACPALSSQGGYISSLNRHTTYVPEHDFYNIPSQGMTQGMTQGMERCLAGYETRYETIVQIGCMKQGMER